MKKQFTEFLGIRIDKPLKKRLYAYAGSLIKVSAVVRQALEEYLNKKNKNKGETT